MSEKEISAVGLLRQQFKLAHGLLDGTMADVSNELAHWTPPEKAHPVGASYAHVIFMEDGFINAVLKKGAPLAASGWAGKTGLSEPPPMMQPWDQWARTVKTDLPALRDYAQAVYANTDEYLASLTDADLKQSLDLSAMGLGQTTLGECLTFTLGNSFMHCGEVSALKGIQGAKGYPI